VPVPSPVAAVVAWDGTTLDEVSRSRKSLLDTPPLDDSRFVPGQILADRYRIVALLGKGGMGEVYRADDLRLGQTVAMKFLPEAVSHDGVALARFHREVRLARQVSHPNVCRVFDIGEAASLPFFTMEYVDGEDLASLLKRIGRLPPDKAVDISRQLCAGLAAAHEAGVLHRDLKPANIMLDRRGKVRITDFGLAGLAAAGAEESRSGTPAYMSPEQLAGEALTAHSDIYSLGLVLYEVFTGKRVFDASTLADLVRQHESATVTSPTQLVAGLDPVVERVILRCLEVEPASRPHSPLQVSAALPGGDPLAAALAAGETPSPEMVAAAGGEGVLQPATAWGLLLATLAVVAAIFVMARYSTDLGMAPPPKDLRSLEVRAQEITEQAGYREPPADHASWFDRNYEFLLYRAAHFPTAAGRHGLAHAAQGVLTFYYRQSPAPLVAFGSDDFRVNIFDPPYEVSGMVVVVLNSGGRLVVFAAVPPQVDHLPPGLTDPDWAPMLADTGLDPTSLQPADPTWLPTVGFDRRFGWRGFYPEDPSTEIHVNAASYRGKPVFFQVIAPWTRSWHSPAPPPPRTKAVRDTTFLLGGFFTRHRRLVRKAQHSRRPRRPSGRLPAGHVLVRHQRRHLFSAGPLPARSLDGMGHVQPPDGRRALPRHFCLAVLSGPGAVCAQPLARASDFLDPPALGQVPRPFGGSRPVGRPAGRRRHRTGRSHRQCAPYLVQPGRPNPHPLQHAGVGLSAGLGGISDCLCGRGDLSCFCAYVLSVYHPCVAAALLAKRGGHNGAAVAQ
jgi:serine/threonine-protein kinase